MRNVTTGGMETTLQSEFGNLLLDLVPWSCELQAFMNSRICEFIAKLRDGGETSASMSQARQAEFGSFTQARSLCAVDCKQASEFRNS